MSEKAIVLIIFILVYLYLIVFKRHRAVAVWVGAILIFLWDVMGPLDLITRVNWNVIGILAGTLIVAEFFTFS
ncbi:hypothetical protein ACFL6L_04155, partial [candidate division KSB1 bacterium]